MKPRRLEWPSGYEQLPVDSQRRYRSETFPGLWLDIEAMLSGELARVLEVVQEGIASAGHAAFVSKLANRKG